MPPSPKPNAKPKDDPRTKRENCHECGTKLVARTEEHHETRGKTLGHGWSVRSGSGNGVTHRILFCPSCCKVRGVDARSGS